MAVPRRRRLHGDIHRPDMAPGPLGRNVHRLRSRLESAALCPNDLHVGMTWGKPSRHGALGGAEANDERRYVP
jgi:hypothetical protein